MNTAIEKARAIITGYRGPKIRIMEVCGTHTHEIFRLGIRSLLPENVELISGPGCPVCVTPVSYLDEAIFLAEAQGLANFSLLTANKTMPAAYEAMASHTDAYLYPGHVCAITGTSLPEALTQQGISGVVAGFTASELLAALAVILERSRTGETFFANCYPRVVRPEGNPAARVLVAQFMEPCDAEWRGLGVLEASGLQLRAAFAARDARVRFSIPEIAGRERPACHCGAILQGLERPVDCPLYSTACTPDHPVGACMVSREGACSAYYLYGGLGRNFA